MEKLVELLNEYHFFNTDCINYVLDEEENRIYLKEEFDWFYHEQRINAERIISKKFWFIKWLVENKKIDIKKLCEKEIESWRDFDWPKTNSEDLSIEFANQYFTETVLMLLAIQDEPMDFLVSILKE